MAKNDTRGPTQSLPAGAAHPVRVVMLFDGNELYGLPVAVANVLEKIDRARVWPIGLFLGRGDGYDLLAPLFAESHCLDAGPLFPLRRQTGGWKYDPIYLSGRALIFARALAAMRKWARRHAFDVVHAHTGPMIVLADWGLRAARPRLIWHCHGAYSDVGRVNRWFTRFAQRRLDRIAAISGFVAETMPESLRARTRVVHNCVPVQRLRDAAQPGDFRSRFGVRPDQPLIGIFGSVVPIKGHRYFLEAAAEIVKRFPDACFAVVGGTTKAFERMGALRELRETIAQLGLTSCVIETGFVPDATRWMVDFDVIAMPSVFTDSQRGEGFGMVMIEAMAQSVAVVATDWAAPPEVITSGVDGLLVPPKNSDALAAAILRLLSDPTERKRIAQAGYRTVQQRFDALASARALEDIYVELVRAGTPPR